MTRHTIVLAALATTSFLAGCSATIEGDDDPAGPSSRGPANSTASPRGPAAAPSADPVPAAASPGQLGPGTPSPGAPPAVVAVVPGAPPPAVAAPIVVLPGRGILGCPIVAAPSQGTAASMEPLSANFKTTCATCHGGNGEGSGLYPPIPGKLDQATFIQTVRKGTKAMPPFSTEFVSDADLARDYNILAKRTQAGSVQAATGEWSWTEAQVQAAYTAGMAAWRKPDAEGAACANCHSPDAVDLAVIGYSDDAILRRAYKHISPADALAVRDLIHAQRRRFGIKTPCSPDWHPFQPGGEVLPGNTPGEQDAAFAAQLQTMGLIIATGKVVTLDDAHRAQAEMTKINLRTLKIGIPLPRWTEDSFRGDQHRTINDHMAAVPHIPNDKSWYAKVDAYLDNPTETAMFDMIFSSRTMTNDGGYLKSTPVINACGTTNAGGFITSVSDAKYRGVLFLQHYMRMAALGKKGWLDLPQAPFTDAGKPFNPWFFIGGRNVERECPYPQDEGARPLIASSLPAVAKAELSSTDVAKRDFLSLSNDMAHAWMTLGQIFDQTLYMSEGAPNNKLNYWVQDATFLQKEVHLPFFYMHRLLTQQSYRQDPARIPLMPKTGVWYRDGKAQPLLDGFRMMVHNAGTTGATDLAKPFAPLANRIRANLYRTILLLQKELLLAGAVVTPDGTGDGFYKLTFETNTLGDLSKQFVAWQKDSAKAKLLVAGLGADVDLFGSETLTLLQEVQGLIAKAPKVAYAPN